MSDENTSPKGTEGTQSPAVVQKASSTKAKAKPTAKPAPAGKSPESQPETRPESRKETPETQPESPEAKEKPDDGPLSIFGWDL